MFVSAINVKFDTIHQYFSLEESLKFGCAVL